MSNEKINLNELSTGWNKENNMGYKKKNGSKLEIDYQCWICPICFDDHSRYTHEDCIKKAFDSVSRYRYKINQALEIINRPYPELTNVDKVAMVKRILEE